MGASLVGEVLARWTHLPDRQFRILLRMAHTALDNPKDDQPARLYFGGHVLLAMTLRTPYPYGDDQESDRARATIHRHVREAVAGLIEQSAIERHGTAHTGHQQDYWITLRTGPEKASTAGPEKAPRQARRRPPRGGPEKASQGTTTGTTQDLSQDTNTSVRTDLEVGGHTPATSEEDQRSPTEVERERQVAGLREWERQQRDARP
jgi:hypothetical protein